MSCLNPQKETHLPRQGQQQWEMGKCKWEPHFISSCSAWIGPPDSCTGISGLPLRVGDGRDLPYGEQQQGSPRSPRKPGNHMKQSQLPPCLEARRSPSKPGNADFKPMAAKWQGTMPENKPATGEVATLQLRSCFFFFFFLLFFASGFASRDVWVESQHQGWRQEKLAPSWLKGKDVG